MTQEFITTFHHKDTLIGLTRNGYFIPVIDGKQSVPMNSLAGAEERIDKEISKTKTKRIQYGIHCLVLGSASRFGGKKYQQATYRGINITSGDPMVTIDGAKTTVTRYHLYRLPQDWAEFERKLAENREAHAITKAFTSYLDGFKVSIPGIRYSDDVGEVAEKERLLATRLQG
jgi:hypothetical protein